MAFICFRLFEEPRIFAAVIEKKSWSEDSKFIKFWSLDRWASILCSICLKSTDKIFNFGEISVGEMQVLGEIWAFGCFGEGGVVFVVVLWKMNDRWFRRVTMF